MLKYLRFLVLGLAFIPQAQAQFTSLYSVPSGSFLQDVVFADTNTMMVTGGNLFRTSIDGGRNWIGLSSGGISVTAAHFPSKQFGITVGTQGLYRTNDECGYFWGWGNNKSIGVTKDLLDVYFINNQKGIVCGNDGTLRLTSNQGTNWTAIATGTTNHIKGVWMVNDSTSFACANGGIILKVINQTVSSSLVLNAAIDFNKIAFVDEQTGYCVGTAGTVYKTIDGGNNWNLIPSFSLENLLSLAFTDLNHGVITGSNGVRFVTEDAGQTWTLGTTVQTTDIRSVAFKNRMEAYCIGSNFVEYTHDGGHTWMRVDGTMQSVHFPTPDRGYACGYYGVAYKTEDGGNNWKPMNLNTPQYLNDIYFINRDTGYAVGGSKVFRTLDGGESWTTITNPSTSSMYSVHFTDFNHGVVGGYRQTIMYTANGGQTWTISQNSNSTVYYLDIQFPSPQIGYMCSSTGAVLKSVNGGATWSSSPGGSSQLSNLFFTDVNTGWAVGNNGLIIHTIDGGASWQAQTSGTTNYLNGVHFLDANRGMVVGSSGTYLITNDGGATWLNRTNGATFNDYTDVFFSDELHGYAVSGISVSGIGPFSNFNPTVPYCPGDNISFNAFDPYHMPNANSQVVLEMTGVNEDFSTAQIIGTGVVDSLGLITSAIPVTTAEGIYKTRIRDLDHPEKVSFNKYLTVSSAPQVSVNISGNTLIATSNQTVTYQWYGNPSGFYTYIASGPELTITASGEYYVVVATGCCTTYSEHQNVLVCNGGLVPVIDQTLSVCSGNSVQVGTSTYDQAGTYSDTLLTSAGCDSIINTTLLVLEPDTVEQDISICLGEEYMIGTSTYSQAGDYSDVFVGSSTCDSLVITHLSIFNLPEVNLGNDTIICDGQTLLLDAGSGMSSYTWNSGADTQTLLVNSDGIYGVVVTNSQGCEGSDSVEVNVDFCLTFSENSTNTVRIYPNPSPGDFYLDNTFNSAQCRIYNALGELVFSKEITNTLLQIHLDVSGIYIAIIETKNEQRSFHIVVN